MTSEKIVDSIKDRLKNTNQDIVGQFYSRLRGDNLRDKKNKIGEIHTVEGLIILSRNTHFYYLDDCAIVGCKTQDEMFDMQCLLFNLFHYLYGENFKVDESCYG